MTNWLLAHKDYALFFCGSSFDGGNLNANVSVCWYLIAKVKPSGLNNNHRVGLF